MKKDGRNHCEIVRSHENLTDLADKLHRALIRKTPDIKEMNTERLSKLIKE